MRQTAKTISYTSGSISANLVSLAFTTYVQFYYIDHLKGNDAWIGIAATIQAIYAILVYPFLGYLSDRTHSRFGRRVPFILYGAIPLGVFFAIVWSPPVGSSHTLLFTAYFLFSAILYDTMFNVTMVNWSALFPELFHTAKTRALGSAWKQMFGIVGIILGLALPTMIAGMMGWKAMGWVFGGIGALTLLTTIPSMELKKRRLEQQRQQADGEEQSGSATLPVKQALHYTLVNRSFLTFVAMRFFVQFAFTMLTADLSYYAKYNLKIDGTEQSYLLLGTLLVALPLVYVWGALVPKMGAFRTAVLAIVLFGLGLLPFLFARTFEAALMAGLGIGVGLSGILILTDVLIADVIDEDELKTGARREGMFYGIHGLIIGLCAPAQAILTTLVLLLTGYTHSNVQSSAALLGFRFMISVIPIVSLVLGLLVFLAYPLRKRVVQANQETLARLRAGQNQGVTM